MSFFERSKNVKELKPKDFDNVVTWKLKDGSCGAILFYAPWCPHCTAVKDTWENLGRTAAFMNIMAFDCEANKSHLLKIKEDLPSLVQGYPTIVFYSKGKPMEQFEGDRSQQNLLKACMRVCQESHGKR